LRQGARFKYELRRSHLLDMMTERNHKRVTVIGRAEEGCGFCGCIVLRVGDDEEERFVHVFESHDGQSGCAVIGEKGDGTEGGSLALYTEGRGKVNA